MYVCVQERMRDILCVYMNVYNYFEWVYMSLYVNVICLWVNECAIESMHKSVCENLCVKIFESMNVCE